mmetsp:Transcript_5600/g.17017  ORF Transcript_5600/g.17017 Transcript_5600/m.17017 type:complete len:236 (-) Transcript_5600:215-922(-)
MRAAARRRLGRVDAVGEHRRDGALHVVAHEREDLLHKRVQLLLEQQRRVLGLYCAEASHAAAVDGRLIVRRRPAARAARGAKERVKHAARAALLGAAVRRLDVLVEQVQQRDGVAQPVRQRGVVFLAAVNLAADDPDDAVKEARALSLERTPLQTAAEDDNGSDRPPPVVTQVGRERRQQPLLLLAALLSQRSCLFGLHLPHLTVGFGLRADGLQRDGRRRAERLRAKAERGHAV